MLKGKKIFILFSQLYLKICSWSTWLLVRHRYRHLHLCCQESPQSTANVRGIHHHPDAGSHLHVASQPPSFLPNDEETLMPDQRCNTVASHAASFSVRTVWGAQSESLERTPHANHMVLLLVRRWNWMSMFQAFLPVCACVCKCPLDLCNSSPARLQKGLFCGRIWILIDPSIGWLIVETPKRALVV